MKGMNAKMLKGLFFVAVVALSVAASSCGNKKAENKDKTLNKDEVVKDVIKYPIPTPAEIAKALNDAKAPFIFSLCNPVEKVDLYITDRDKALNLGVYGANLSYSSTYGMKQETLNYLKVSKVLIDELQISTRFNAAFAERVERNIDNKDSLTVIISNSFFDTYAFLQNNGKDYLSILVMTGSWVEGLYTTVQIAISTPKNGVFLKVIANQKRTLDKLLELMDQNKESKNVEDSMSLLFPIKKAYETVNDENLTKEQFEAIASAVIRVRQSIVM
jgi:hypothetical protein